MITLQGAKFLTTNDQQCFAIQIGWLIVEVVNCPNSKCILSRIVNLSIQNFEKYFKERLKILKNRLGRVSNQGTRHHNTTATSPFHITYNDID